MISNQKIIKLNWGRGLIVLALLVLGVVLVPVVRSFATPVNVQPVLARFAAEQSNVMSCDSLNWDALKWISVLG